MANTKLNLGFEHKSLKLRVQAFGSGKAVRQLPERGWGNLFFSLLSPALVVVLSLCMVVSVQAQSQTPLPPLVEIANTPPQRVTAVAIVPLCAELGRNPTGAARIDLRERCTELVNDASVTDQVNNVRAGLQQMAAEEMTTQGTVQVEVANVQITDRLAALRGGATGVSVRGFVLNINGQTFPGTMLASLFPFDKSSEVASAGEPNLFPKLETSINGNTFPDTKLASLMAQAESSGAASTSALSTSSRLGVFLNGTLTLGDKDATSRESGFDFDNLGITGGVDYRLTDNLVLGAAFGFANTDVDLDSSGGGLDTDTYTVSLYGTYYVADKFYIDGITSFGWMNFDSDRNIRYSIRERNADATLTGRTILVNQTAEGDTNGTHFSVGFGSGYNFRRGGWTFGPFFRLNYLKVNIDGFREGIDNTNSGFGLALRFGDQDVESLTTDLGAQASYAISTPLGVFVPQVLFEWEHESKDDSRIIPATFVNDPTPSKQTQIQIQTDDPDRDYFNLGVGLSAVFRRGKSAFVYYQTVLGLEDITAHSIVLGGRLEF